eukprot:CAMPEP_0113241456 /NCGR_PEP_ID=MMETSP0008_2-20120614/6807_1 /TAXON_ID=97485 /ORGANISM="Prymnesium parvum" /LENGTH=114 /DNA_ID=CAMNT_0000088867 /DNA_START=143 /DNA_END=484 /DNA_ORIENTATION=+ /assembly_acc=CAM_ASM_000153
MAGAMGLLDRVLACLLTWGRAVQLSSGLLGGLSGGKVGKNGSHIRTSGLTARAVPLTSVLRSAKIVLQFVACCHKTHHALHFAARSAVGMSRATAPNMVVEELTALAQITEQLA